MRKFKTFGMAVGMVVALAGCAGIASATEVGDAAQTISERSSEFQNLMLQYAIENDAAQLQIDILRQASISFDDIWIAYEAAFQCIQDAGGQIYHIEETHSNGIPTINYSFSGLPTEAADLCQTRYTWWLGAYWGIGSPLALARNERVQAATTPYIQQCLSENGIAFPSEATFEELELLAWNMLAVPTFQAIHCQFDFDGEIVTLRPWLPIPDDHRAEWLRWVEEGGVFSLGS